MEQTNQLDAQASWFHVFKSMFDSGDIKKLGPYATTIYLAIKAHTNWKSGKSWPGIDLIIEKTGISKSQVLRSIKILCEHGYLITEKVGRNNIYKVREKVQVYEQNTTDKRPIAEATWDYIPASVKAAVAELRNFIVTNKKDGLTIIQIENLTINQQQNFGQSTGNFNAYNASLAGAIDWTRIPDSDPVKKAFLAAQKTQGK